MATSVINPRTRHDVTLDDGKVVTLPRNFSWLWPGEIAVSSTLERGPQVAALNAPLGVTLVVTLIKEEPLRREWFDDRIKNLFVPVTNYEPPTTAQMDEIVDAVVRVVGAGGAVMEHCGGGKGRAGTVAACLLLRARRWCWRWLRLLVLALVERWWCPAPVRWCSGASARPFEG